MPDLPSGTVVFLFTDVEGSTRLWERDRTAMLGAVERHLDLLRGAVASHGGVLYKTVGDGTQSAFASAGASLSAALDAQRALLSEPWPAPPGPLQIRMALHAGEAAPRDGDYLAAPLNRLSRLLGMAQGGQVFLTEAVAQLAQDDLPDGASLRDLGERHLRDLERSERIFVLVHPELPAAIMAAPDRQTRRFPGSLTPFLGRESEVAAVSALLSKSEVRLLTLIGPGGIGKTRLSLEVGKRLAPSFADGAVFVDLAPLRDASLVQPTIATALDLRASPGRTLAETVSDYLTERQTLLLLDNFEQLLDAAAGVSSLLETTQATKALVTSRSALRVRGEREYPVPTFRLPTGADTRDLTTLATNEAVAFFVDRVQAVRPDFNLTAELAPVVAEICQRLDGLPLALELAAARARMLPLPTLLARLSSRLPLLTGGGRDAPERQRTLHNAIAWSHDLLSNDERKLFRRLGAFTGGFTLEAAEAVVNHEGDLDVLEGLVSLGDKSLVRLDESGPEPRYAMLETIREYAVERLAASDDEAPVRDAHAAHFTHLAIASEDSIFISDQRMWRDRIGAELPNLRAALSWLERQGDAESLLTLAARSWWAFWDWGHVQELRAWLDRSLAHPGRVSPEVRAHAYAAAAVSAWYQGDNDAALRLANAGLGLSRREGLDLQAGWSLFAIALVRGELGDFAQSLAVGEEAIMHLRRSGYKPMLSQALLDIGFYASLGGNAKRSTVLREEGFAVCREIGNSWGAAVAWSDIGSEAQGRGDPQTALHAYRESLQLILANYHYSYAAHPLAGVASIVAAAGKMELAARLLGAAAFTYETQGATAWLMERQRDEQTAALARGALGEQRFDQEFAAGRTLPIAEAVQQALDAIREDNLPPDTSPS
jgi:predicted ATPase/class 3 adenylate cyclase